MRKRKRTVKTKRDLHVHARRRALERLGIHLSKKLRVEIIAAIQSGNSRKAKCIAKQSLLRSVFDVTVNEEFLKDPKIGLQSNVIRVVYDTKRHAITTVLTQDMDPAELDKAREEAL